MRISWIEILGLLVGLAMCYGVIYYAIEYAPQNRETASEGTGEEASQQDTTAQQTTASTTPSGDTKTVTIRITGSGGQQFGANVGNLGSSRAVEGTVPNDYEVEVQTDPDSGDYVSVTAWKTSEDRRELKVQLLDGGQVVRENSTTKDYGATGLRWRPSDPPIPKETTKAPEKAAPYKQTTVKSGGSQP